MRADTDIVPIKILKSTGVEHPTVRLLANSWQGGVPRNGNKGEWTPGTPADTARGTCITKIAIALRV